MKSPAISNVLRKLVFTALDNAVKNGYKDSLFQQPIATIVDDLTEFDSDLESKNESEIASYVVEWFQTREEL